MISAHFSLRNTIIGLSFAVLAVLLSAHIAHAAGADIAIDVYTDGAVVTVNSITPPPTASYDISLSGGSTPSAGTLFGGTATIAAGTAFPVQRTFASNTPLTGGQTYYVRVYVHAGTSSVIYPAFAEAPLAVVAHSEGITPGGNVVPPVNFGTTPTTTTTTTTTTDNTPFSFGNTPPPSGGLVPCGNPGQEPCQFKHLLDLISNVVNYVFLLVIPIAAGVFIFIGFRYITSGDNAKLKSMLKGHIGNLVIGIIIVLVAWLAVATLLRALGVPDAYVLLKL